MLRSARTSIRSVNASTLIALATLSCGIFPTPRAPVADKFGEPIWRFQGQAIAATRLREGRLYLLDGAAVIALDAATGAPVWRYDNVGVVEKDTWRFTVNAGRVAALAALAPDASSNDVGRLTVLSAETGELLWQNDQVKLAKGIAIGRRTVWAFDAQYHLVAFDADTGAERGRTTSAEFTASIDHSGMRVLGDLLFTTGDTPNKKPMLGFPQRFFAFDGSTGKVKWFLDDRVRAFYLDARNGSLILDLHSPEELAKYDPATGAKLGIVAEIPGNNGERIVDGAVVYLKQGAALSAMDGQTGKTVWKNTPPFQISRFIGASDKTLYALHTETKGCLAFNCPTSYYVLAIDKATGSVAARVLTNGYSPNLIIDRARVYDWYANWIAAYPAQ